MNGLYDNELEGTLLDGVVAMRNRAIPTAPLDNALRRAESIERSYGSSRGRAWRLLSAFAAMVYALLATLVPEERRSATLNLAFFPFYVGSILGPFIGASLPKCATYSRRNSSSTSTGWRHSSPTRIQMQA